MLFKQCRCWISNENGAIWAFIAPMILIIMVCMCNDCTAVYKVAICFIGQCVFYHYDFETNIPH